MASILTFGMICEKTKKKILIQQDMNLKYLLLTALFTVTISGFAQLFAGIEIGGKGIKMSVLKVNNLKRGNYDVKEFWTENTGIAKGIADTGNLTDDDIENTVSVVSVNFLKMKQTFLVPEDNIYIVGSSGVGMAKNTQVLIDKIKKALNKDLEFIDAKTEAKMLLRGCVPPSEYLTSMVLDIGGGNTKGGYVDSRNNDNFVFFPVSMNYGTVTLTEAVLKKTTKSFSLGEYKEISFAFLPTLREQIKNMYASSPLTLEKEKVYMSGGAVWAFYTLTNGTATKNFSEFTLEDVINYDAMLKNNFKAFETLAKNNKEAEAVLKTYSQKYLISGSNILQACLEALPNLTEKKLYFAKEGKVAWLVSYVTDKSTRIKKIY